MSSGFLGSTTEKSWDPSQYNKFAAQREQPFWDLASLLQTVDKPKLVDLGCGDGRLTSALQERIGAETALGIDFSTDMLSVARTISKPNLRFEQRDIAEWRGHNQDIIFANASLQWVSNHDLIFRNLRDSLASRGQLAVQVPSNADHPVYLLASQLGENWLGDQAPIDTVAKNVYKPEQYATLLYELGFNEQNVRLQVYDHRLNSTLDTLEWVKGTSLNRFKSVMDGQQYKDFLEEYKTVLIKELGEHSPYFFTFKRILIWGQLP